MIALRPFAVALSLVTLPLVGCGGPEGASDAELTKLAAPELGCEADQVKVVSREVGKTNASYVVEGCDKKGSLLCETPMQDCVFAGSR